MEAKVEDTTSRGTSLAAITVLSRMFHVLHEQDILTEAEINQVLQDADMWLAHHTNDAALAAKGSIQTIRDDWPKKPPV